MSLEIGGLPAAPKVAAEAPVGLRSEEDWMALFANAPVENFDELGTQALTAEQVGNTSAEFFAAISSVIADKEMMADVQVLLDTAALAIAQGHAGCGEEALNSAVTMRKEHVHVPGEHDADDEDDEDIE